MDSKFFGFCASRFHPAWHGLMLGSWKYAICRKQAEVALMFMLCFSSSSGAQRLNQIKLFFNEQKEVQKTRLGVFRPLMASERETETHEKKEAEMEGGRQRGRCGRPLLLWQELKVRD